LRRNFNLSAEVPLAGKSVSSICQGSNPISEFGSVSRCWELVVIEPGEKIFRAGLIITFLLSSRLKIQVIK
jgi:hypothetical protein